MSKDKNSNNIERQRTILGKLKAMLEKYTKIYEEDGIIDSEEQKSINKMNEKIKRAEDHLAKLESGEITPTTSTDKEVPDETTVVSKEDFSSDLDPEVLAKKRKARDEQLTKMETGTEKIGKAIKKKAATPEQIEKAITKYEAALEKMREKALEDGEIDDKEQKKLDLMQQKLEKLRQQLNGEEETPTGLGEETPEEVIEETPEELEEETLEEEETPTGLEEETPEELEETTVVEGNMPEEEEETMEEPVSTGSISRERVTEHQSRLQAILAELGL